MQEPGTVDNEEQNSTQQAMESCEKPLTVQEGPSNQVLNYQPNYSTVTPSVPPGSAPYPPYSTVMPDVQPPVMYNTGYPTTHVPTAQPPYYSSVPANVTQQQPVYGTPMAPYPNNPPTAMPPYPISIMPGPQPAYSAAIGFVPQQQHNAYQDHNALIISTQHPQARPKDYLCWSILSMIFCCCPLGLAAVVFSTKTSDAMAKQDWTTARRYSSKALVLNFTSLGFGIIFYMFFTFTQISYLTLK